MAKTKAKVLSESEVEKQYRIVKGFNVPDGDEGEEKRFEATTTPGHEHFVTEKDFEPAVFKTLLKMEAIEPVVSLEEVLEPDELADAKEVK